MDDVQFDRWARSLVAVSSRRGLAQVLVAALGLRAIGIADMSAAGKDRRRKRRKQRRRRQRKRAEARPFCAGIDVCQADETPCEASGDECRCFVREETGEPFCGLNMALSGLFPNCAAAACAAEDTCVTCTGGVLCARPCPNPL